MEGQMVSITKTFEGYTWRMIRNTTDRHTSYMWNVTRNLMMKFVDNLSTPWCVAVDHDWSIKLHVLKCASQPPGGSTLALLRLPSQSGKGVP